MLGLHWPRTYTNNNNAEDVLFEWMPQKIIFVHGLEKDELCIFENKINRTFMWTNLTT